MLAMLVGRLAVRSPPMRYGAFIPQGWRLDLVGIDRQEQWPTMLSVAKDIESAKVVIERKGQEAHIPGAGEIEEVAQVRDWGVLSDVWLSPGQSADSQTTTPWLKRSISRSP